MSTDTRDRSLGDLFTQLTGQVGTLIRQEIALAQAEMHQNTVALQRNITVLIAGAAIVFAGFLALLGTGIVALAQVLPWWGSALIVGGGTMLVGLVVMISGQAALRRVQVLPSKTLASLIPTTQEVAS